MKALIGRKIGMTQLIQEDGVSVPVTLLQAGPCTVVQVKDVENDGYMAVQLGYENDKNASKAVVGHAKKAKITPKIIREFRINSDESAAEVGSSFDVTEFSEGDEVTISGTSKGKGFAGTIKRHNFARGPVSHGSRNVRKPGSIGSMYPQKIFKGHPMAGQMGNAKVTVRGCTVALVDKENNVIGVRGAVPGPRHSIVTIAGGAK